MNFYKSIKYRIKKTAKYCRSGCLILCYHRVGNDTVDKWGNSVSVENFRDQMEVIKNYYFPVSMDELVQSVNIAKLPEKRCAIVTD